MIERNEYYIPYKLKIKIRFLIYYINLEMYKN